ncbi:MAG: GNAT family N-acetyltransferase [Proteobacteria bacterium]|nr:GNAT family N-acetyltransferase [Pseudomonadota bacterium]
MKCVFERLAEQHRKPVIDIFNFFGTNGFAAYPETKVDYSFFDRLLAMVQGYPAVVVKDATDRVVGFGMLCPFHFASTFKRTAEITYFLTPETTRQGIGTKILAILVEEATKMGVDSILASISSRNSESINFHIKRGFVECGKLRAVGRKFGESFDVVWMQKRLL